MLCVVTGAAGFIGHRLTQRLLDEGHEVRGIDNYSDYYDIRIKQHRISELNKHDKFSFYSIDLAVADLDQSFEGAEVVFHLAGQPGVRTSWRDGFGAYTHDNVLATQRVLEQCYRISPRRVVYASSSSVYGNKAHYPSRESDQPAPYSPYAVTKLAGEHLAGLYAENFGLPTMSLRFFTVFGPGQRPEMAISRMVEAGLTGGVFPLMTSPSTIRDFTYVDDVVDAVMRAGSMTSVPSGSVFNVCGGAPTTMGRVLEIIDTHLDGQLRWETAPACPGDVDRTGGDNSLIKQVLDWEPKVSIEEGVFHQLEDRRRTLELTGVLSQ